MIVPPISRRESLASAACGFGSIALAGLAHRASAKEVGGTPAVPHHLPRAKRVIFLFMQGGPSHVDTFDYKPILSEKHGQKFSFDDARALANTGKRGTSQTVKQPLWKFRQYGECGLWASDLFQQTAVHADKFCMVHSMHTEGVAHGPATLFLHCGATNFIRPSMGAWVNYGLGSENENLPGFVSIAPSPGNGGARNYGTAFLPPRFQGTTLGVAGRPAKDAKIRDLVNAKFVPGEQSRQFALLQSLNAEQLKQRAGDAELEAVANSYELAWRMQNNAPNVIDLAEETATTQKMYGIGEKDTNDFGQQCLMARRFAEAGVRYIQVTYGDAGANPAWDQHSNLPKHEFHAKRVDKPIAGLLQDLNRRGLLEDTLVWWGGEFGRTPYAQNNGTGRDHNPGGFTMWLAGGGVKPGFSFGATDKFGAKSIENKVHMHDMHATILHLLGMNHEQLTYNYAGRDFRLTDVHGRVVRELLQHA
jgi:hypothetical protein